MPNEHAKLSASGSHIWMNCPKSYSLTKDLPDVDTPFSEEGTRAHAYCEYLLHKFILNENVEPVVPDNKEMELCGFAYLDFISSKYGEDYETLPDIEIEQRLDFSPWVEDGFGTCDCLIITRNQIKIIDFKYGKGVKVDANENSQLQLYALGALNRFELYDFKTVEMNIFQPRLDHISTQTKSVSELIDFGKRAKELSKEALNGKCKANPGAWCKFCKVNAICKARAREPLETIKRILEIGG